MKFIDIKDLQALPSSIHYIKKYEGMAHFEGGKPLPIRVVYEKHAVGPASVRVLFSDPVDEPVITAAIEYAKSRLSDEGLAL